LQLLSDSAACNALGECEITYRYGTPGSGIAGVLSTETISFSNTTEGQLGISNFRFGCMNNDTSSFGTVDGLVGFGRGPLSLPSQLSQLTSFNVFSYCLVPFLDSVNLTSSLLFGASNSNGLDLVYTPILSYPDIPTFYWVNMTGISINGTALRLPEASLVHNSTSHFGGTLFDSGTTLTIVTEDIGRTVVKVTISSHILDRKLSITHTYFHGLLTWTKLSCRPLRTSSPTPSCLTTQAYVTTSVECNNLSFQALAFNSLESMVPLWILYSLNRACSSQGMTMARFNVLL
jgi:hypothetical protein